MINALYSAERGVRYLEPVRLAEPDLVINIVADKHIRKIIKPVGLFKCI